MLSKEDISKAEKNVNGYLIDGLLARQQFRKIVFDTYMRNHRESLIVAKALFQQNISNLWIIVASYYSMFYIANALLYKIGYKTSSKVAHKVTADALIVFVRHKLKDSLIEGYKIESDKALSLSDTLLEAYDLERDKRSTLQYETTEEIKSAKAKTSLSRAEEFSKEMEKLII